jgi:hypothetical protein
MSGIVMIEDSKLVDSETVVGSSKSTRQSKRQEELLEFIYAYRFVTTKQVQVFLGKKQIQQAQQRLNTLLAKGYIDRRFTSEDRLLGRYATYYLSLDGLKLLKRYGSPQALKNMRKDATASESFLKHNVTIGDIAADLIRIYHNATRFTILTKNELLREDANNNDGSEDYEPASAFFPQPLPDMCIDHMYGEDYWTHYLAEVWHSTVPFWVYRKRIQYYIEHVDEEACEKAFFGDLLPLLLICDTSTLQRRVQRYLRRMSDRINENELKFSVTNQQALQEASEDTELWTIVGEDGSEVVKLVDITVNP